MRILDIFDAVQEGTYKDFKKFYNGDVNEVQILSNGDSNLLSLAVLNDKNPDDKIKIINFLIEKNINTSYVDNRYKRNALHWLFFSFLRGSTEHILQVAKLLIENGVEVNSRDGFGAIPLQYAISSSKLSTEDMHDIYLYLLASGSDYNSKDDYGNSCLDYAEMFSRDSFIDIVKEYENENK